MPPDPASPRPLIPKPPRPFLSARFVAAGGSWLLTLGFILAFAALLAAGGLAVYQRSLDAARAEWVEQVELQEQELRPDLLAQLTDLNTGLNTVRELLSNHVAVSNAFVFLQATAHPKVQFNSFSFSRESRKIELAGVAASYHTVAEQIRTLEAHPQVEAVQFGGLSRDERGLVSFKLSISVKPELIAFRGR